MGNIRLVCVSIYASPACCLWRSVGDAGSPVSMGLMDGCELLSRCWELNPGPLQDQLVLLTTEPPSPNTFFTANCIINPIGAFACMCQLIGQGQMLFLNLSPMPPSDSPQQNTKNFSHKMKSRTSSEGSPFVVLLAAPLHARAVLTWPGPQPSCHPVGDR